MIAGSLATALAVLILLRAVVPLRSQAAARQALPRLTTLSTDELRVYHAQRRSFYHRWAQPALRAWLGRLGIRPMRIDRTFLTQAGLDPDRFDGADLRAWKLCGAALGLIAGLGAAALLPPLGFLTPMLVWIGMVGPSAWLGRRRRQRQDRLREEIADLAGLLRALVSVGLPLEQALHLIASQRESLPLSSEEVARTMTAFGLGVPIEQALDDMSRRTGLDEMAGLVGAITTARRLGSALEQVLRDQEMLIRVDHRHRATAAASRVGTRLLAVLAGVYLPEFAVLIVIPLFWGIMRRAFG
jgi:Flp pilus assembly protein TadB